MMNNDEWIWWIMNKCVDDEWINKWWDESLWINNEDEYDMNDDDINE